MKKLFLTLICVLSTGILFSQTEVKLEIRHKLGDMPFAFNQAAANNMSVDFSVTRLEYYISQISLIHDGNTITPVENLILLANAGQPIMADLGSFNVNQIEGVSFYIGVDSVRNHSDPALYDASHPLAPRFPSMHWGWASGYRFLAIEGMGGSSLNRSFQLHALGDQNYFKAEVMTGATQDTNGLVISIDADYTRVIENIDVSSGVLVHGDYGEALMALENFRDYVFGPAQSSTSIGAVLPHQRFTVYPNPSHEGTAVLSFDTPSAKEVRVSITDLPGRVIYQGTIPAQTSRFEVSTTGPGLYFISVSDQEGVSATRKWVVR